MRYRILFRHFPNDARHVSMGKLLYVVLSARSRPTVRNDPSAERVAKRVVHVFCQEAEKALTCESGPLLTTCPEPSRCSSYHPLSKSSRMKGSNVLKTRLLERFGAKSGGYVSTKDELTLMDLGMVAETSRTGSRIAGEFMMRYLAKASSAAQETRRLTQNCDQGPGIVNWCMDAARVAKQQAPLPALCVI